MRMSPSGRAKLIGREGARLHAYKDSVGVWTIGVGHTSSAGPPTVTPNLTISREECDQILSRDLVQYETAVNKAVKASVNQNQFDALVSLCFNIGTGGLARSTVVKRLNAGDTIGAADAFLLWNKPPEIMGRRRGERAQFLEPAPRIVPQPAPPDVEPPLEPIPVPVPAPKPTIGPASGAVVTTGAGGVVANEAHKSGVGTSEIAVVLIATLIIAIGVFFIIRNWRH